jgi:hypothetical protein
VGGITGKLDSPDLKNPTPGSCALEHANIEAGYKTRTLDMANKEIRFIKIYVHTGSPLIKGQKR